MEYWQAAEARHSVREFAAGREVDRATIERLLAAAVRAPSAGNCQPWQFVVVQAPELRDRLAEAAGGQRFVAEAPVVIVVCAEPERSAARYGDRGRHLYCLQDTAAACEHLLLGATALGLGGCWVGAFDEDAAARVLDLPARLRPVAMLPIGLPDETWTPPAGRRPLDEVVSWR